MSLMECFTPGEAVIVVALTLIVVLLVAGVISIRTTRSDVSAIRKNVEALRAGGERAAGLAHGTRRRRPRGLR